MSNQNDAIRISTGHVGLNVTDLERSRDFYRDALGLTVFAESREPGRKFAFLGDGSTLLITLWQQADGHFEARRPGLHHLSFEVPSIEAVRAAEERLRTRGVAILHDGIVAHAEGASSGGVFFEDPDGIRLEIFTAKGAEAFAAPTAGAPTCGFF